MGSRLRRVQIALRVPFASDSILSCVIFHNFCNKMAVDKMTIVVCVLLATLYSLSATMANDNVKAVVAGNNGLTGNLYKELAKPGENLIYSPISLHSILSLVYQGSEEETSNAIQKVLDVPDKLKTADGYNNIMSQLNSVPNVTLNIANKVYVATGYTLKPTFKEVATKQFFSDAENLEFTKPTAASTINGWVEGKTNNKIKDLIKQGDLNADTRLVLVNAIYFKGNWADKFRKENTRPDKFYISETDTVDVDMMARTGKYNYKDDEELDAQVIELPYANPAVSMIVVLPKSRTGIDALEKKLANYDMNKLTSGLFQQEVELSLPKFKIESELPLNEPLKNLGMGVAFGGGANFSGLLEQPEPLYISKVIQKAFIEVNEEGAEAAAATGVVMTRKSAILVFNRPVFRADHPFVYALVMKDIDVVLFKGKIASFKASNSSE